jgi:hypothetical protein
MQKTGEKFTDDELHRMQAETGVDVYALLDFLECTPTERLRIAEANATNLMRLRGSLPLYDTERTTTMKAFDPLAILTALHQREVRFVVIGGVARYLLGSFLPSANLDICFASDTENARKLAVALNDLHAHLRGSSDEVDEQMFQSADVLDFKTDGGLLRCVATPAGTDGFADLQVQAECIEIGGMKIFVAGLKDLIRMKEALNRTKDRATLVTLRAMQNAETNAYSSIR